MVLNPCQDYKILKNNNLNSFILSEIWRTVKKLYSKCPIIIRSNYPFFFLIEGNKYFCISYFYFEKPLFPFYAEVRFAIRTIYFPNSFFTLGNRIKSPIMLGNTKAKIMASENLMTASNVMAAPSTVNNKNTIL